MNINTKNNNRKKIVISTIILTVLAASGVVAYFYISKKHNTNNSITDSTSAEPQRSESDKKQAEEIDKNPSNKEIPVNTDTSQNTTSDSNGNRTVGLVASYDIANDIIHFRGGLNTTVTDGSCYVLLKGPNGQSVKKDTELLQNPSSTDCKTVTITKSELSSGKWIFTLNYSSSNLSGQSDEISFSV